MTGGARAAGGARRALAAAALLAGLLLAPGCAGKNRPIRGVTPRQFVQEGLASWYGRPYHGRKTSSGERYDMHEMTAAHRTLPFGTIVEVKNLENGRRVQVRINDRGPFKKGRILDVSYAAARKLDMIGHGVVRVRIRVVGRAGSS